MAMLLNDDYGDRYHTIDESGCPSGAFYRSHLIITVIPTKYATMRF